MTTKTKKWPRKFLDWTRINILPDAEIINYEGVSGGENAVCIDTDCWDVMMHYGGEIWTLIELQANERGETVLDLIKNHKDASCMLGSFTGFVALMVWWIVEDICQNPHEYYDDWDNDDEDDDEFEDEDEDNDEFEGKSDEWELSEIGL